MASWDWGTPVSSNLRNEPIAEIVRCGRANCFTQHQRFAAPANAALVERCGYRGSRFNSQLGLPVLAIVAVIVMQVAHWIAFRLRPQLRFRRNVLVGHVLVFIGELSLFFIDALAVVILFDRGAVLDFVV
jgi:hypothetical protein